VIHITPLQAIRGGGYYVFIISYFPVVLFCPAVPLSTLMSRVNGVGIIMTVHGFNLSSFDFSFISLLTL